MPAPAPYLRALERLADAVRRQAERPERHYCTSCGTSTARCDGAGYDGVSAPLREALMALDVAKAETVVKEAIERAATFGRSVYWAAPDGFYELGADGKLIRR